MPNFAPNDEIESANPDRLAPPPSDPHAAFGYHRPVMVAEVLQAFEPIPGRLIIDGTLGGGGHTRALLAKGRKSLGWTVTGGQLGIAYNI